MTYKTLQDEIAGALNRHGRENKSNTPDFILAKMMIDALAAFESASLDREKWYGKSLSTTIIKDIK